MKLQTITNANFSAVLNELKEQKLPVALAYKLSKILKVVADEQQTYETVRRDIVERYAVRNEDGSFKTLEGNKLDLGENYDKVSDEIGELMKTEVEVQKIELSALLKAEVKMTAQQLFTIADLIDDSK